MEIKKIVEASVAAAGDTSVTVRFKAWTPWQNTAYQRGQMAGFSRKDADRIVAAGLGVIVLQAGEM